MKNPFGNLLVIVAATVLSLVVVAKAHAGKIVVDNDEWTLSNTGFSSPNDPAQFARNVANWFDGGTAGKYLAYSSDFGLTGTELASTMTSAGKTWTISTSTPFTLANLLNYNGVFLAGNAVDDSVLINYVKAGGNVYLAGGTGWVGAVNEAAQWNPFLNAFGLGFAPYYNGVQGNIAINSAHPIFAGVNYLYQNNGNDALDLVVSDPRAQVLISNNNHGLYAVYDSGTNSVPEPGTLLLLGSGLAGLGLFRRKIKKAAA